MLRLKTAFTTNLRHETKRKVFRYILLPLTPSMKSNRGQLNRSILNKKKILFGWPGWLTWRPHSLTHSVSFVFPFLFFPRIRKVSLGCQASYIGRRERERESMTAFPLLSFLTRRTTSESRPFSRSLSRFLSFSSFLLPWAAVGRSKPKPVGSSALFLVAFLPWPDPLELFLRPQHILGMRSRFRCK